MKQVVMTQDNDKPDVYFTLTYADDGSAVNISGATVDFVIASAFDLTTAINSTTACVIDDGPAGECHYEWAVEDTATAGKFIGELTITFADTTVQTVYNQIEVIIRPKLGGG